MFPLSIIFKKLNIRLLQGFFHNKESILEGEPALAHAVETADKQPIELHSLQCSHRYRLGRERP